MHYITLLFKCNALHYTLLFTNFKQTKLVHIETFTRTCNKADFILYGKQFTLLIFNFMFHKVVNTKNTNMYKNSNVVSAEGIQES